MIRGLFKAQGFTMDSPSTPRFPIGDNEGIRVGNRRGGVGVGGVSVGLGLRAEGSGFSVWAWVTLKIV